MKDVIKNTSGDTGKTNFSLYASNSSKAGRSIPKSKSKSSPDSSKSSKKVS